jgi:hypothetical protein
MEIEFNVMGPKEALSELSCWGKITERFSPTDWNLLIPQDNVDDFLETADRLQVETEMLGEVL